MSPDDPHGRPGAASPSLPIEPDGQRGCAGFFQELVLRTDGARRHFECSPAVLDVVAHGMELPRYRRFLMELYHVVWHFNPITAAAVSRMEPAQAPFRSFLYRHLHEEDGHDDWVLQDLASVGGQPQEARRHPPSVPTLGLVGFNHWQADRGHPFSVFGMLYALEVIASVYAAPFASALRERLLLDGDRGVSFLVSHASLDTHHLRELGEVLQQVPPGAAREAVVLSADVNFHLFTALVEAVQ